ncbi:MAG: response regulator transcription factor [Betaproteobacteria bacterium]
MSGQPGKAPWRIGLLDDHAVVRSGYRRLIELEDDLVVIAEFADAESAYAALTATTPCPVDLLVLDLSLPGQSGLELLRHLSLRLPALRILAFTMHDGAALVRQCLRAGAAGFVTKSSAPDMLLDALRRIARGEIALSEDVAALAHDDATPPHAALSVREFDILQRLVNGHGVERIAQTLHLSTKTVANYQTEIRHKLGAGNAVELMQYARRHGIATL